MSPFCVLRREEYIAERLSTKAKARIKDVNFDIKIFLNDTDQIVTAVIYLWLHQ